MSERCLHDLTCPLCRHILESRFIASNQLAVAVPDAYPLSPGHTLVLPRRHQADYFQLSQEEQDSLWRLVADVRVFLDGEYQPDAYNVGFNNGRAAGQTVMHLHVHVIPRYAGDSDDPRGGIRWILPDRALYWER